ncbi:MAG: hypothetical protein P1Q69_09765 [Candidatus Thorarchaeota archaeon]|nr:hypothetical protein [Candidatus Thorarchaeota archaeon]
MSGGHRERWIAILKEWKSFVLLIAILLLLPYSVQFPSVVSPFILDLRGLFYEFQVLQLELVIHQSISIISIINLILVIVPSAYFTFRYKNKINDENIAILAFITFALTLIVVTIVDYWALTSPWQVDTLQSPTPNLQFLPGFTLLLLFSAVIVPLFKEYATDITKASLSGYYRSGFRSWVSTKMPKTTSGWLLAFLLVTPTLLLVELPGSISAIWSTNIGVSLLGPYFTLFLDTLTSGSHSGVVFLFILGGYEVSYNLLAFQILSLLFSLSVLLYIQNRISRRLLVASGLLSFAIPLFLSLFSFFSLILTFGRELIIPIPLLQILGILLNRRIERLRAASPPDASVESGNDSVTVPVGYIFTSLVKRIKRGKNQNNGESLLKRDESIENQEETES